MIWLGFMGSLNQFERIINFIKPLLPSEPSEYLSYQGNYQ